MCSAAVGLPTRAESTDNSIADRDIPNTLAHAIMTVTSVAVDIIATSSSKQTASDFDDIASDDVIANRLNDTEVCVDVVGAEELRQSGTKTRLRRLGHRFRSMVDLENGFVDLKISKIIPGRCKEKRNCRKCMESSFSIDENVETRRITLERHGECARFPRRQRKLDFSSIDDDETDITTMLLATSLELRDGRFEARFPVDIDDSAAPSSSSDVHIQVHGHRLEVFAVSSSTSCPRCRRLRRKTPTAAPRSPHLCGVIGLPMYVDPLTVIVRLEASTARSSRSTILVVEANTKGGLAISRRRSVSLDDLLRCRRH